MELLTAEVLQGLPEDQVPCYSIYMPTHRKNPENVQDPIRFKNIVTKLKESLLLQYSNVQVRAIVDPLEKLGDDHEFWNHTLDGLALFGAPGFFKVIKLHMPVKELVIVANNFHTKPLRKYLQTIDRYYVLDLNLGNVRLFEGNRHSIDEVDLVQGIPKNITEALGDEARGRHLTVASYGGLGAESGPMHHGHGSKKDEIDKDVERFFRIIAKEIHEKYSKPSGLPLILAALPEYHNLFQKISNNPLLLEKGITVNPQSVSIEQLAKMAWEIIEPDYKLRLKKLADAFEQAKSQGTGDDNIERIALAAVNGKIDTLLVEADRIVPGKIDIETGCIEQGDLKHPEVNDLIDEIGALVSKSGGKVVVIPKENMPTDSGIAAILHH